MAPRFRHELKYIVPLAKAKKLFDQLKPYSAPDSFGQDDGTYEVASLYYDTDDLRFYWDREESVGYRRKVRLRSYNRSGKSLNLSLEIKEKHKHLVSKKRQLCPESRLLDMFSPHSQIPLEDVFSAMPQLTPECREAMYLHSRLVLQPQVIIRYLRTALVGIYEHDLRITLDTRLTAGGESLIEFDPSKEKYLIAPDKGVLEVKSNSNLPLWLQSELAALAFRQTRFSKYCLGMTTLYHSKIRPPNSSSVSPAEELQKVA